jgi:hypothetical protein
VNNDPASGDTPSLAGTRLSTVLLIRRDGQVLFIERDIYRLSDLGGGGPDRDPPSQRVFRFALDSTNRTPHVNAEASIM